MQPYGLTKKKTRYIPKRCACGVCGNIADWQPSHERKSNKMLGILAMVKREYGVYGLQQIYYTV